MTSHTRTPLSGTIMCQALWARDGRELADFYATALGTTITQTFPDGEGNDVAFAFHVNGTTGGQHWTVLLDPSGQPFCIHGTR
ncbi:hypothetical protein T261_1768 [Streptomyces lydicus]|nr:hypothetical protein T261_1768 [Streptomyces lydicus]